MSRIVSLAAVFLADRVRRGEYERITSAQTLADSLTAHLQAVSSDRHLRVRYS